MAEEKKKKQFINFGLYKMDAQWWRLDPSVRESAKKEVVPILEHWSQKLILRQYALLGLRADSEVLFWRVSEHLEDFNQMSHDLRATLFGSYLTPVASYLSMGKRSTYVDKIAPEHTESRAWIEPGRFKYIFVYPFVKTREWYLLPLSKRQEMMDEHIRIGNLYPSVKLNTTYSFGLDDQDFVVAFESDHPDDFLDLVMKLRESQASLYTVRDTPIYTGIHKSLPELISLY